jgi:hypothetical protein
MSTPPNKVETTFYAQVVPKFGRRWDRATGTWIDKVDSVTCKTITQKRPAKPAGVVVKLTLRFNEAAFLPLKPAATIEIPDSLVAISQEVDVEALDENDQAVATYLAEQARQAVKP